MPWIGQVRVGPRETNLIWPNTPQHFNLNPLANIMQLNGHGVGNILF